MTVYTDSFTGTNGSSWSAQWTIVIPGGTTSGVVDIQGNRGRMNTPNLAYYSTLARFNTDTSIEDFELYVEFTFETPQVEQYPVICWRANGTYNVFGQPNTGMSVYYDVLSSDEVGIERWAAGSNVYSESTAASFSLGVPISTRIRVVGDTHKVKWWTTSGSEPTTGGPDNDGYQIKKVDSTLTTGEISLVHGAQNINRQTFWDNFSLDDLVAGGGTEYNDLGLATTITSTHVGTSQLGLAHASANVITSTQASTDQLGVATASNHTVTSTTATTDARGATESLATSASATTATTDQFAATEALPTVVTSTSQASDTRGASETSDTVVASSTFTSDNLAVADVSQTLVVGTVGTSDSLGLSDLSETSVVATTATVDQVGLGDESATLIVATVEVVDSFNGGATGYSDDLSVTITSTVATSDLLGLIHQGATLVTSTVDTDDRQGANEPLPTSISSTISTTDSKGALVQLAEVIVSSSSALSLFGASNLLATLITSTVTVTDQLDLVDEPTALYVALEVGRYVLVELNVQNLNVALTTGLPTVSLEVLR